MASARRMGPKDSDTRRLMLDSAEDILRDEGYAALTSRRVAERVGLKQRLVYYYFETMDDLVAESFRRLATREIARLGAALDSPQPLHELWSVSINTNDARLVSEFMALANRNPALRDEVIAFIQRSRELQVQAVSRAFTDRGFELPKLPPVAITLLATSVALACTREAALGVSMGHAEIDELVSWCLARAEPAPA